MRIYLDHNATSPLRDEVVDAMTEVLARIPGNPSSTHEEGRAARSRVDRARDQVASLLGVAASEVLFTGGATESNNTVLLGIARRLPETRRHVVVSATEHPSIDAPLEVLEAEGWRVTRLPVDADGLVSLSDAADAVGPHTGLVSVIWANNETGVLQPVAEIAELAREHGAWMHTDATQAVGKAPVRVGSLPVDLLSLTAHKFNGPKGTGCLVLREGAEFAPILHGGPQEKRRRGGTENVAGIVGLGVACALAERELTERVEYYARLRDRLWDGIESKIPNVRRNGSAEHVLSNTLNVEFRGAAGELLLQALDIEGVAVSAGAACHSGSIEPSGVLVAMGRSPEQARGSLRLSVGLGNDESQIDGVTALLPELVERARRIEA
jgi:cysteine desulfurase